MPTCDDLFRGRYVLIYPDGSPLGLDQEGIPRKATHPQHVTFFLLKSRAERIRDDFIDIAARPTMHRVEGLRILQERFSY
jgi:hypothetical protein